MYSGLESPKLKRIEVNVIKKAPEGAFSFKSIGSERIPTSSIRSYHQVYDASFLAMASAIIFFNSPDSANSKVMSQPPCNSPPM